MIRLNRQMGWIVLLSLSAVGFAKGGDSSNTPLPVEKGAKKLSTFDYHGVTLDSGRMRAQMDEVCDEYLRIPNDDLLKGFRARAGLPAPGNDLGGWYSDDIFHVFGQIVSGLSRLYAATGNVACRDKANALLLEWSKCIEPDGYFFYSRKPNSPHYIYDKMLWGLLDAYLYCGNQRALNDLSRITDWAIKNLEHTRKVFMGFQSHEWYTLSENLYRAYLITGDPKYRDFAKVWEYPEYWDMYARKQDIFAVRPDGQQMHEYHAYSHVNTLGGAGAAYCVTGDPHYLAILKNAYDDLQAHQVFVTGGYGPSEQLLPHDKLALKLADTPATFETQCGTWAVFKLVKYLLAFTGDARYGDWAERLAINGIGATIHMSANGRVFYYSDYSTCGGEKCNYPQGWACCTGTRPQVVADFCDLIYLKDAENLCVNLFAPSTVQWQHAGANVHVQQTTRFPEDGAMSFTISTDKPVEFGLKIRSPQWLAGAMTMKLNGKPLTANVDLLHWCTVRRTWQNGDRLEVILPMRLEASHFTAGQRYPAAIAYGPVVLAARAASPTFARDIDLDHLDRELTPVPGDTLTWRLVRDSKVLLRPFYAYKEGERYYLYLDPHSPQRITLAALIYQPEWQHGGDTARFTNKIGATAECHFEGTGIRWLGGRFDNAGRAEVSVDGKVVATVDQYAAGWNLPFQWEWRKLPPGKHVLRLRLIAEKSPQSKDHFINVVGFDSLHDEP